MLCILKNYWLHDDVHRHCIAQFSMKKQTQASLHFSCCTFNLCNSILYCFSMTKQTQTSLHFSCCAFNLCKSIFHHVCRGLKLPKCVCACACLERTTTLSMRVLSLWSISDQLAIRIDAGCLTNTSSMIIFN